MKQKIMFWTFVMLLLVVSVTATQEMEIDKYCQLPTWHSDTSLDSSINKGNISINFYPICCGIQYNSDSWKGGYGLLGATRWGVKNLPRCNLCQIKIIEYYGTADREYDTGWVNLSNYYIYADPDAKTHYNSINAMDFVWIENVKDDDGNYVSAEWGATLFNHSIEDPSYTYIGNVHTDGWGGYLNGTYNHTFNLNVTGTVQIKILVRAGEQFCDLYRGMYKSDYVYSYEDPGCYSAEANVTPNTIGYGTGGYYTETINLTVVDSGGTDAGEGSTTKGGASYVPTDTFITDFENYDVIWWILTFIAVGFILVVGGIAGFKGKDNKLMMLFAGLVLILMIFTGGYLGAISWTYFVIIGILGLAGLAYAIRGFFTS